MPVVGARHTATMDDPAARIQDLYERHAEAWIEARSGPFVEKAWIDRFLALVSPDGAMLDLGCGSGRPIARYFVEQGRRVTGVDSAPALVESCAALFPDQRWLTADMVELALGSRFDGIIAWDSLFHLRHDAQRRMFAVFAAHAAPGAALMFTSGPAHGEAIGEWQGEPLYHASLEPCEYESLLLHHGFALVDHVVEDPACGHRTVWLARKRGAQEF